MRKLLLVLVVCSLLFSCAGGQFLNSSDSVEADYVSPAIYKSYTCNELETAAAKIIDQIPGLEKLIDERKKNNDAFISTGAIIMLPLLAGLKSNKEEAELLAQYKGNIRAIKTAAMTNRCEGAGYMPQ